MFEGKTILAVIPARGGSKRLPKKNIRFLHNKPLIAWTIEAAGGSHYVDDIIISTDDDEIIDIARALDIQIPFKRPEELATDDATSIDVVLHTLDFLATKNQHYDYIILLQPTSPMRNSEDIDEGIRYFFDRKADSVIGVCEAEHNPIWSNTLPKNNSMDNFLPSRYNNMRSQELPIYYRINGAFYMTNTAVLKQYHSFFVPSNIYAFVMSQEHSVDIDTELDFIIASSLIHQRNTLI